MKRILLFFITLLTFIVNGQDIIVKRNGDSLITKLIEVDPVSFKYKLSNYQDGPVFVLPKEEVQFVIYGNGTKEMYDKFVSPVKEYKADLTIQPSGKYFYYKDKRITETDMLAVCAKLKDPKLNHMIKKIDNLRFIQHTTTFASIGLFVSGLYIYETNRQIKQRRGAPPINTSGRAQAQKNGSIMMLSGLACGLISVSFYIDRRKHDRVVVNAYNDLIVRLK
ncbi:MAG: hypothetical protein ACXVNO_01130 [Bacteroidia bacterium]